MNKYSHTRSIAGLCHKSALAVMTAVTLIAVSGSLMHASAKDHEFDDLRYPKDDGKKICDPPAAPEVATWCIGGAVLSIGGAGHLRRKWLASRQAASN
jgi:hypothetical protein